ncbi:MAG: hypothetical protein M1812_005089 [Candelaria pacifica]|nr:MAG: hypothetical protein M1812_005089 [Candelaria pacifica]
MAPPIMPGSPEASDDDSISLTSTIGSERFDEYIVDAILAEDPLERGHSGPLVYLAKWEGYPLNRSTWEPIDSFSEDTLQEWQDQKMRITRGYEKPFDIKKFEAGQAKIEQAQLDRQARRRAKKIKLGLPVPPLVSASEDSDEAEEEEEEEEESAEEALQSSPRKSKRRQRQSPTNFIDDNDDGLLSDGEETRSKRKRRRRARSPEESDDSLTKELKQKDSKKHSKRNKGHGKPRNELQAGIDASRLSRPRITSPILNPIPSRRSTNANIYTGTMARGTGPSRVAHMGTAGRGPSRLKKQPPLKKRPKVEGAAIFGNWNAPKKARNRQVVEPGVPGSSKSKTFDKLSIKRRFEKASHNEPAPDPAQLVFYNLKEGGKIVPNKVPVQSSDRVPAKTPHQMIMEQEAHTESNKSNLQRSIADRIGECTAGPGLKSLPNSPELPSSRSDQPTGQQIESLISDSVQNLRSEASLAPACPTSIATESSVTVYSPTQTDSLKSLNNQPRSKSQSISFTAYTQRRALARESASFSGSTKEPELIPDHAGQVYNLPKDNMGNINSSRVVNEHPLAYFIFGEQNGKPAVVDIVGLDQNQEARIFKSSAHASEPLFFFERMVTAEDYKTGYELMDKSQSIAIGDILTRQQSQYSQEYLEDVIKTLKLSTCGGIIFRSNLTIIIYPVKMDAWAFLDTNHHNPPTNTMLRFQVHPPISPQLMRTKSVVQDVPFEVRMVDEFREVYGIQFEDLLPQNVKAGKKVDNVFVICPLRFKKELKDILGFLEGSGATISTEYTEGAWEKFVKRVEFGVVLLHPSVCHYHEILNLSTMLRRNINFFHLGADPNLGSDEQFISLTRLFPHGRAILLTEDLLLKHSATALEIVLWFKEEIKRKSPGTWKLVGRPRLSKWLMDRACKDEGREGPFDVLWEISEHLDEMLLPSAIEEGLSISTPAPHAPIVYCEKQYIDPYSGDEIKYGADPDADAEYLVSWFASWASMKATEIRRFFIVDPSPKAHWRLWHTIEVCNLEEFAKVTKSK